MPHMLRQPTSGGLRTGAVRSGDDLQQVPVRVAEVHAATPVVAVDLALPVETRIGPVVESAPRDPPEDLVEIVLVYQERVVLRGDLAVDIVEVQRYAVAGLDHEERSEGGRRLQPEDLGEERRRPLLLPAPHDGVVELHAHRSTLPRPRLTAAPSHLPHPAVRPDDPGRSCAGGTRS